jgi:hypothetical protein
VNNAGMPAWKRAAAGGGVATAQTLSETGLALMPLTGTFMGWVLLPVAAFALVGGGCALLRTLPRREE